MKRLIAVGLVFLWWLCLQGNPAHGAATEKQFAFDIVAMPVGKALMIFAQQSSTPLLVSFELVHTQRSNKLKGQFGLTEGLQKLLNGTGLVASISDRGVIVVSNEPVSPRSEQKETHMRNRGKKSLLASIPALFLSLFSGAAAEAQSDEPKDPERATVLETVLVTATRREENIHDVALSISAIGDLEIDRRGLVGMSDYLNSVPGVTMQDRGAGRNAIVMRGVSIDPQEGGDTVGVYLGEIPLTGLAPNGAADLKLVDMERIEVLRGPQGTLYGASSLGGAVKAHAKQPNLSELEGIISAGLGTTDGAGDMNYDVKAVVNLPLIEDQLALRVAAYQFSNGGYFDNIAASDPYTSAVAGFFGVPERAADQKDVGESEYTGGRISLLWQPGDRFSAQFTAVDQELTQDGFPEAQLELVGSFNQARFDISGVYPGGERLEDEISIQNLVFEYEFESVSLLSSSSWIGEQSLENRDASTFLDAPVPQGRVSDSDSFIQELRVTSHFEGPLQFVAGVFYEDVDIEFNVNAWFGGSPDFNPFAPETLLAGFGLSSDGSQEAVFGELSYEISDQLKLTLGGRYFEYDVKDIETNSGVFLGEGVDVLTTKQDDQIYKVNLGYTPREDALVYLQWAQGFRLGGTNVELPAAFCDINGDGVLDGTNVPLSATKSIDPDTLDNFELGVKTVAMDGRVTVSAALYRIDWEGMPVGIISDCGEALVNAGSARVQGFEVETALLLNDAVSLNLSASYVDGELRSDDLATGGMAGDRLPGSAEYTVSAALQYEFDVVDGGYLRGDYNYVGGYFNNLGEVGPELGDYHLFNITAGVAFGAVDVEVYANNLFNSDELVWLDTEIGGGTRAALLRPRTLGAKFRYRF